MALLSDDTLILKLIPRLLTAFIGFSSEEAAMSFATGNQNVAEYIRKCLELDGNYFASLPVRINTNKFTQKAKGWLMTLNVSQ